MAERDPHGVDVEPSDDAADRGALTISPRVVEKIASEAALGVDGVVPSSSFLGRVTSRDLPRVDADLAGSRTRIEVEVAAVWPTPLPALAALVRDEVKTQVQRLVPLTVDGVSVAVAEVVHRDGRASGQEAPR